MDWLCGDSFNATDVSSSGLAGSEIQDCHIELAIWICHLLFSIVCSSILILFHYCLITTKPWTFRYREHNSRWIAALGLLLLVACQAGEVCASELTLDPRRYVFLLTPLLALAAALLSCFYFDVVETYQLSVYLLLPATYWFFAGLLHVVKLVHLYEVGLDGQHLRVCLTWAAVLIYMILFAIKASILITKCPSCTPFEPVDHEDLSSVSYRHPSSNLISKCVFWWMNPMLRLGCKRPLELSDLGRLPGDESAERHLDVFSEIYNAEKEKMALQNGQCPSLWKCFWLSFWPMLTLAAVFRLLADLVSFLGPLSISVIVSYAAIPPQDGPTNNLFEPYYFTVWDFLQNGYVMAALVFVTSLAQSAFSQAFTHLVIVEGIHVRTALQAFIFKKALRLPAWVTVGEGQDMGSIVNYISSDAYNVLMLFIMGHYVWAVPLKIAALLALLYRQLGYSALLGAASMLLLVPLQYVVGSYLSKNQKGLLGSADVRLKKINEVLQGVRQLKLYAWEFIFGAGITRARDQELKFLLKHQILLNINAFLTDTSTVIVSLVTFAVYPFIEGKPMAATDVFSGLALFSQLAVPLILFPITVPIVISAMVSTERLSRFLEAGDRCPEDDFPDGLVRRGSSTMLVVSKTGSMYLSVKQDEPESSENEETSLRPSGPNLPESKERSSADEVLEVEKATLAWKEDAILRDVSFTASAGQLTIVVGGVGSGKSSLLLGLLGEMKMLAGSVKWNCDDSPVAYVPQKPWLLNATIRENILFGKKYLPNWYDSVTAACSLKPDLEILPDGDQTEIGEKGVTLSGGQRQRIALARALYCKAKSLILDDPTSALDAHVALHVFENAILHSVHRRRHAIILVTNRIQFLSKAHQIIVLEGGRIKHRGTFEHILKSDAGLRETWMDSIRQEENEFDKGAGATVLKERRKLKRMITMQSIGVGASTLQRSKKFARGISLTRQMSFDGMAPLPYHECGEEECALPDLPEKVAVHPPVTRTGSESAPPSSTNHRAFQRLLSTATYSSEVPSEAPLGDEVGEKLLAGEDRERGTIKKRLYIKYIQCCGWPFCFLFLAFSLLAQAVSVWRDFWLSHWSESSNIVNNTSENLDAIMHHYLVGYSVLSVSGIVLAFSRGLMGLYAGYRALRNLHCGMLDSVVRSPIRFFDVTPVGRILNRFSSDMGVIDRKLQITLQTLIHFILLCLSAIAVNAIITPYFLVITLPVVVIYYFIQHFFRFSSRELQRLDSLTKSPIMTLVSETLGGLTTIRAFREEKRFISRMLQAVDKNNAAFLIMNCANRWLGITLDFLGSAVVFLATILAIVAARNNHVTPAFVGLAVSYTLLVPIYLNWVVRHLADLEMYMSAVERVDQYSHLAQEPYNEGKAPPPIWPHSGAITFQEASMRYDPTLEPAISKLTLTIRPGEKVGVCGRTGGGKSTLALALFRMLDTFEGTVSIDGIPINTIKLLDARAKLSVVPQDAVLFMGTLRWNIDPNNFYSDEKIWDALELVQMKDTVLNLPGRLANEVAAGGENFSAGQKQLICLARAILRRSKVLVMDEATATLDGGMDHVLQEVIAKACSGRTIITIAHHISTIMNCDTVIVMDQGRILERGAPRELLAQAGSTFAALAHSSMQN